VEIDTTGSVLAEALGWGGAAIFFSRFYVQWFYSERAKKSVIPIGFWYMSACGSLMLFTYGVITGSPLGVLSHSFNIVVYSRNLVHLWREKGKLSARRSIAAHGIMGTVSGIALLLLAYTWFPEYQSTQDASTEEAFWTWFFLMIGVAGQALFASRFLIQWALTEYKRKSTVPTIFWYLSIAASLLQIAAFAQRAEWVYALGLCATLPVYLRNLWLIHFRPEEAPAVEGKVGV